MIWLDNVMCTGNEKVLKNCTASFSGNNSCTHAQDAGVRCSAGNIVTHFEDPYAAKFSFLGCVEGDIRLAEGATRLEGRVEICRSNQWGTVCHTSWEKPDARVVCRQLGLSVAGNIIMQRHMRVVIIGERISHVAINTWNCPLPNYMHWTASKMERLPLILKHW